MTWTEARGRAAVRERSQGKCEICGLRNATEWSHRLPRSAGGTWHPGNGLDACRSCHVSLHAHRDPVMPWLTETPGPYSLGLIVRRGTDPFTVAMRLNHPVYGPGWWLFDDRGALVWLKPWQPPRALEQLPTHKTGRVVRHG